jgi:hypothetical protein
VDNSSVNVITIGRLRVVRQAATSGADVHSPKGYPEGHPKG